MNEVHISGVVKRTWTYGNDLYARLSLRRDRGRPQRAAGAGGPFDYVTVLFTDGLRQGLQLPTDLPITVHGWVQSRDVDESLAQFLNRAGAPASGVDTHARAGIVAHRSVTEIVAERWDVIVRSSPTGGHRKPPR